MSDRIEKAAQVIDGILSADPQVAREMFGDEPDRIARALAEAGMLAPAPLREEVGYMEPCGEVWSTELPGEDTRVRRYVTDWAKNDG